MSKTFKSAVTKSGNRTLLVSTDIGMDAGFFLEVQDEYEGNFPICFNNDTAPALALAILEAAGVKDTSTGGLITHDRVAMTNLQIHIEKQERATAEAEAQAKLEDEALKFFRVGQLARTDGGFVAAVSFSRLSDSEQAQWIAVAEQHRKMAKEAQDD